MNRKKHSLQLQVLAHVVSHMEIACIAGFELRTGDV
jgi:hypothetical protein